MNNLKETDPKSPIFAAQVFTQILGMSNHPEHYLYEDQEIPPHACSMLHVSLI